MSKEDTRSNIRNRIKQKRIEMNRIDVEEKSKIIQDELFNLEEFLCAKTITFYAAKKEHNEVETEQMIRDSLNIGKRIIVPITDKANKRLIFSEIKDYSELKPKTFKVPEPKPDCLRLVPDFETDLIIVPGIVFDKCGYRLGYGFGYYDKFLCKNSSKIPQIGLAYEFQINNFPVEEYDIPVDKVTTEYRIIECRNFRNA